MRRPNRHTVATRAARCWPRRPPWLRLVFYRPPPSSPESLLDNVARRQSVQVVPPAAGLRVGGSTHEACRGSARPVPGPRRRPRAKKGAGDGERAGEGSTEQGSCGLMLPAKCEFLVWSNPARGRRIGSPGCGSGEQRKRWGHRQYFDPVHGDPYQENWHILTLQVSTYKPYLATVINAAPQHPCLLSGWVCACLAHPRLVRAAGALFGWAQLRKVPCHVCAADRVDQFVDVSWNYDGCNRFHRDTAVYDDDDRWHGRESSRVFPGIPQDADVRYQVRWSAIPAAVPPVSTRCRSRRAGSTHAGRPTPRTSCGPRGHDHRIVRIPVRLEPPPEELHHQTGHIADGKMADDRLQPRVAVSNRYDELRRGKDGQQVRDEELVRPCDVIFQVESNVPLTHVPGWPCPGVHRARGAG